MGHDCYFGTFNSETSQWQENSGLLRQDCHISICFFFPAEPL